MIQNPQQPDTIAARSGFRDGTGAVVTPIYQSAMYRFGTPDAPDELAYGRYQNTPNHMELERRFAGLERAEAAVVTGSGMGAIGAMFLSVLSAGDHVVALDSLYGGTLALLNDELPRLGIDVTLVPLDEPESWAEAFRSNTKLFHAESVTNPLLRVPDHKRIVSLCRERGVTSSVDSTFTSPVNFTPITQGYNLVVHSATKYLNGHADVTAGVVCGSTALIEPIRAQVKRWGPTLDPHACFLLERGIKTLFVRVDRQNATAAALARWLKECPEVSRVIQPSLEDHADYVRASELLAGPTGMLSFELADEAAALGFLERLELIIAAPSLGGVETNATRPVNTSHAGQSPESLARQGISPALIRVSCGLEHIEDLKADLAAALG
ncbi:MAG: aminotransferase class I/II-fold pyridoxal phosphate-dependent enzyme [Planctomycetota bacterium]